MTTLTKSNVRLFASSNSWIEGEALRQLYAAANFDGLRLAVGFPDLHPGKGSPVGAAFVTEGLIYPYLIGGDIGCGMALFKTDLVQRDIKLNRWADLRFDLEHPWAGDVQEVLAASELEFTEFDQALGTLGGGNHFAELQLVDEVLDAKAFKLFGLGKQQLVVLVHSGSRGLGESTLRDYVAEHQASGSDAESFAAAAYLQGHDLAVRWAKTNRALIARRFVEALGAEANASGTVATTASHLVSTKVKLFGYTARELWQPNAKLWSSLVRAVQSVTWSNRWVMAKAVPGRWLMVRAANGHAAKPASVCANASACIS